MQGGLCKVGLMRGGSHVRQIMQGGLREVCLTRGGSHTRWVSREVDYARYESPSEMCHSLIFYFYLLVEFF